MLVGKIKYILITVIIFIVPGIAQVQADCSYERKAELSRIASNVQFSYDYEMNENGNPEFTVTISNLTNDIYIEDDMTGEFISGIGERNISYPNGSSIQFKIYSNDQNCYGDSILTQHINLPYYNYYSSSEECRNYPNFAYCQMWLNTNITTDAFNNALGNYKQDLQTQNNEAVDENTLWENLLVFWNENKIMLIMAIVCIIILIAYICLRKRLRRS